MTEVIEPPFSREWVEGLHATRMAIKAGKVGALSMMSSMEAPQKTKNKATI